MMLRAEPKVVKEAPIVDCICCPRRVAAENAWYFMGVRPEVEQLPSKDAFGPLCKVCYEQLKAIIQQAIKGAKTQ